MKNHLEPIPPVHVLEDVVAEIAAAELQLDPKETPEASLHIHAAHELACTLLRAQPKI